MRVCRHAAIIRLDGLGKIQGESGANRVARPKKNESTPKSPEILYNFFLAADRAKLRITHKERNQWGCAGSRCVEYAFVSETFLREVDGAVICQSE